MHQHRAGFLVVGGTHEVAVVDAAAAIVVCIGQNHDMLVGGTTQHVV